MSHHWVGGQLAWDSDHYNLLGEECHQYRDGDKLYGQVAKRMAGNVMGCWYSAVRDMGHSSRISTMLHLKTYPFTNKAQANELLVVAKADVQDAVDHRIVEAALMRSKVGVED